MKLERLEVLIFEVAGQRHALPAAQVQELLPALAILPLPGAPPPLAGVINLRGAIVPVLNARQRLGLPARPLSVADHFVIVRGDGRVFALHVDRALELACLEAGGLTQPEAFRIGGVGGAQVAKLGNGLVLLHQAASLLSDEERRAWTESRATTDGSGEVAPAC